MSAAIHACQGGWCKQRQRCANYQHGLTPVGCIPSDRLCEPGLDGESHTALVVQLAHIEWRDGAAINPTSISEVKVPT